MTRTFIIEAETSGIEICGIEADSEDEAVNMVQSSEVTDPVVSEVISVEGIQSVREELQ